MLTAAFWPPAGRNFERMLNVHREGMEKSAQHVANPFSRRPVSEDEIRSRATGRARHDVIGEQIFPKAAHLELWQLGNKWGGGVWQTVSRRPLE